MDKYKYAYISAMIKNCKDNITHISTNMVQKLDTILKLIEPHVLSLEEILEWEDSVWVEEKNGALYPALIKKVYEDRQVIAVYDLSRYYDVSSCEYQYYNKIKRFWTNKPTKEQQENTKWEELED